MHLRNSARLFKFRAKFNSCHISATDWEQIWYWLEKLWASKYCLSRLYQNFAKKSSGPKFLSLEKKSTKRGTNDPKQGLLNHWKMRVGENYVIKCCFCCCWLDERSSWDAAWVLVGEVDTSVGVCPIACVGAWVRVSKFLGLSFSSFCGCRSSTIVIKRKSWGGGGSVWEWKRKGTLVGWRRYLSFQRSAR